MLGMVLSVWLKLPLSRCVAALAAAVAAAHTPLAQATTYAAVEADGLVADTLAEGFLCDAYQFFSGDVGVFVGLLIAAVGFWMFITQSKGALIMILAGVLVTAIPGFFISALQGLNTFMSPLNNGHSLSIPACAASAAAPAAPAESAPATAPNPTGETPFVAPQ